MSYFNKFIINEASNQEYCYNINYNLRLFGQLIKQGDGLYTLVTGKLSGRSNYITAQHTHLDLTRAEAEAKMMEWFKSRERAPEQGPSY